MSFKGFQKSIVRAPQNFRAKFNIGENTKDPVYSDAERRFQELEKETKMLNSESKKYGDAINGMGLSSFFFENEKLLTIRKACWTTRSNFPRP